MANIFDDFKPDTTAAPATPTAPPVDPNAYQGGFLHKFSDAVADRFTYGLGDVVSGGVGNAVKYLTGNSTMPDIAQQRANTQQERTDIGPIASGAADVLGSAGGPLGKAPAMAADAATSLGAGKALRYLTGIAAAGGEGAATSAAGTLGHGGSLSDAGTAAELGGGTGALTGLLGVGSLRGGGYVPAATQGVDALEAAKNAKYAALNAPKFDPNIVDQAYRGAANSFAGQKDQLADLTPGFKSTVKEQLAQNARGGPTTAGQINGFARAIDTAGSRPGASAADSVMAGRMADALTGDSGVLVTAPTVSGHAVGVAKDMHNEASLANSQFENAKMIQGWDAQAKIPGQPSIGDIAPAGASQALKSNPKFYTDPDVNAAMQSVASVGQSIPSQYLLKHAVAYPVIGGALAGAAHGGSTAGPGENPWGKAAQEAIEVGGGGLAVGLGAKGYANLAANRAIARAAPTLTAGAPFGQPAPVGDLLRNYLYSKGAQGAGY
jgi:hypothetical protein